MPPHNFFCFFFVRWHRPGVNATWQTEVAKRKKEEKKIPHVGHTLDEAEGLYVNNYCRSSVWADQADLMVALTHSLSPSRSANAEGWCTVEPSALHGTPTPPTRLIHPRTDLEETG